MHPRIRESICAAARATPDVEVCGFIYVDAHGDAQILPCANISPEPATAFEIDVQDHIRALHIGPMLLGVYHSHPAGGTTAFSPDDLSYADELALPLYLAASAGDGPWSSYIPTSYHVPVEGRPWCLGFSDCWELPRIYWRQHRGVHMGDYERDESFCHEEQGTILANYEREGFLRLPPDPSLMQVDDILMFKTARALPQHFGVFVGQGGYMLHHQQGALSGRLLLTDHWLNDRLFCIFRRATPPAMT